MGVRGATSMSVGAGGAEIPTALWILSLPCLLYQQQP